MMGKCSICGHQPRAFALFGGGYWSWILTDRFVCSICNYWALRILGGDVPHGTGAFPK